MGRTVRQALASDPAGATNTDSAYDSSGRLQSTTNPYRSIADPTYGLTTNVYDGLNRRTLVTYGDSNTGRVYYGATVSGGGGLTSQLCASGTYGLGYPTLVVDQSGNKHQHWTDGLGKKIEVDEPDSTGSLTLATCYKYNALGNPTEVDQGVQVRTYVYDGLSRATSESAPESGTTNFYFTTSLGGVCSGSPKAVCRRTDARNVTTTYGYDAENRLTSKSYSDSTPTANYFYDETSLTVGGTAYTLTGTKGRLSHTSVGTSAITVHSYDAAGRVQDLRQCTPFNCSSATIWNVHYNYNLAGDATSWTHPAGYTVTNTVTNAQRVSQITSSLNDATHPGTLATLTYAPQGAVSTMLDGCAGTGCVQRQETYDYNNRLQAVRIQLGTAAAPAANSCLVYNYYSGVANPSSCGIPSQATTGNNRNVIGHFYQDSTNPSLGNTESFAYDPLNRLTTSVATGSSTQNLTFSYDRYGNMTCVTNGQTQGPCPNWTFSTASNRISNANFTYDAAGNLTQDGTGLSTHTYQWDAEGRLKSVDNGTAATYVYNALGLRVEKQVGATYTEVIYNTASEPVGENNRTSWTQSLVPFNGRHVAHYQSGVTYFPHANTLKSTTAVSDYSGAMTQDQLYYPFGQEWSMVGSMQEDRFAQLGHRDGETTFDPTYFRMYSSGQGRWMTRDPKDGFISNPQTLNLYAYVRDNPTRLTDPGGDCPTCCGRATDRDGFSDSDECVDCGGDGGGPDPGFQDDDPSCSFICTGILCPACKGVCRTTALARAVGCGSIEVLGVAIGTLVGPLSGAAIAAAAAQIAAACGQVVADELVGCLVSCARNECRCVDAIVLP